MKVRVKEFGVAGHCIVSRRCQFHMCTQVGEYLVSTVGEFYPDPLGNRDKMDTVGAGRLYETMVFRAGPPCREPGCMCGLPEHDGESVDFGAYNVRGDAQKGHRKMVTKWKRRQP